MSDLNLLARKKIFWEKWFIWANASLVLGSFAFLEFGPLEIWVPIVGLCMIIPVIVVGYKYQKYQKLYWQAFNEKTRQERIEELRKELRK